MAMPQEQPPPCPETMRMAALMVRSSAHRLSPADYAEGAARLAAETALARILDCLDESAALLDPPPPAGPG